MGRRGRVKPVSNVRVVGGVRLVGGVGFGSADGTWIIYREGEPILAIDADAGVANRVDDVIFDLMQIYRADRRISALLPLVLGPFAP